MPNLTPVNLSHNGVTLELVPYGLTLRRLLVAGRDVLVGPEDAQELPAKGHHYRNTVIGRNTSRLPVREISVDAAGDHFTLKPEGESVALHGGPNGFDTRDWTQIPREHSQLFKNQDRFGFVKDEALFALHSPDGDQGFPGAVHIEALYQLRSTNDGDVRFDVVFRACITDKTPATPINLTQHTGYNMSGLDDPEDLTGHHLWVNADERAELEPDTSLSTGRVVPLPFDLQQAGGQELGHIIHNGSLDDNVILKHHTDEEAVAELSHKNFPYKLRFFTNQSSVMVYLGNFFDESDGTRKNLHDRPGKKGVGYPKHGGAFLEFHQPVGMLLYLEMRKHSSTDGILRQGQVMEAWHSTVVCPK